MFKKTALIAGIGLALSATAQADYQWELDAGYARGSFDYKDENPRTVNGEHAAEEKCILELRGICNDFVNPLYRRLSVSEKEELRVALKNFGFPWI